MNESIVGSRVFFTFFHFFLILFVYYFCKILVSSIRSKKEEKADTAEKVFIYLGYIGVIAGISLYYAGDTNKQGEYYFNWNDGIYCFTILLLPALLGLYEGFEKDAKMTKEQRLEEELKDRKSRNDYQM